MLTDEQLRKYSESLPAIYREILAAFPRIEPYRKRGYGLAFQTLAADFNDRNLEITAGEIVQAADELAHQGLAKIEHGIFIQPTELGERLIAIITGKQAPVVKVPKLPPLPV
jgi:hypothetical protein